MEQDNRLVLGGVVNKTPQLRHTPAGIPVMRFSLRHESLQQEAGLKRQVICQIGVVASGEALQQAVLPLQAGDGIRVSGFMARANNRDGEYRLILHADTIERL